jgi:two-component system, OmpR family, response regulator
MRLLVVEDDRLLADYVRLVLKEDGHAVDVAAEGDEGQMLAMVHDYDVIVLDLDLPGRSGLEVLEYMRQHGRATPVIILTAASAEDDLVHGLNAGADDYLAKPFSVAELRARVRALGRRRGRATVTEQHSTGDLLLNRLTRTISRNGQRITLTPREYSLLEYFLLHPEQIVTRTELLEKVWDVHFDPGSNVIDVHVARLRTKLQRAGSRLTLATVRGSGFMLTDPPPPPNVNGS